MPNGNGDSLSIKLKTIAQKAADDEKEWHE